MMFFRVLCVAVVGCAASNVDLEQVRFSSYVYGQPLLKEADGAITAEETVAKWLSGVGGCDAGITWCDRVDWLENIQWRDGINQKEQGFIFSKMSDPLQETFVWVRKTGGKKESLSLCVNKDVVWGDEGTPFVSFEAFLSGRKVNATLRSRREGEEYRLVWDGEDKDEYVFVPQKEKSVYQYCQGTSVECSTQPVFVRESTNFSLSFPKRARFDLRLYLTSQDFGCIKFCIDAPSFLTNGEWRLGDAAHVDPLLDPLSGLGVCLLENGRVLEDIYIQSTERHVVLLGKIEKHNATIELCAPKKVEWKNAEQTLLACRYMSRGSIPRKKLFTIVGKMPEEGCDGQCSIEQRFAVEVTTKKLMKLPKQGDMITFAAASIKKAIGPLGCFGGATCAITLPGGTVFQTVIWDDGIMFFHDFRKLHDDDFEMW